MTENSALTVLKGIGEKTAVVKNNGGMDTEYSVLRYENGALCDFKKVFVKVGESVTVEF